MSEGDGSNAEQGGGEVETCWVADGKEDCEKGGGVEICGITDGT